MLTTWQACAEWARVSGHAHHLAGVFAALSKSECVRVPRPGISIYIYMPAGKFLPEMPGRPQEAQLGNAREARVYVPEGAPNKGMRPFGFSLESSGG